MHFLILDPSHLLDFTSLGHTETRLPLTAFETPLETILSSLASQPDCIIQQESLNERHFVTGLEHAPCPTFFFSFDTHLNLYWHRYYARLFDAVLTPHPSLFRALPKNDLPRQLFALSHAGYSLPWTPHARRRNGLGFCGRMTGERPLRAWMLNLLRTEFPLAVHENLDHDDMLALYADSRIAPNEAICFEVNCRLFEAASAGAVPLTQNCGPDQEAVFTPDEEMLVYEDGLELMEKVRRLIRNPDTAERIGRAAWERVRQNHLPRHRAAAVLDILPGVSQLRACGQDAALARWLTSVERVTSGDMRLSLSHVLAQSDALPQTPEMIAALLRLLGKASRKDEALSFCRSLLELGFHASSGLCMAAASACAVRHGDFPLGLAFWNRFAPSTGRIAGLRSPKNAFSLCLAWADNERAEGRSVRPGFRFLPEKGMLPACAFEFLVFACEMARQYGLSGLDAESEILGLLAPYPAYMAYRLHLLSGDALSESWRRDLETASLSLRCCLVEEGRHALIRARDTAEREKETEAFGAALAASPARAYSLPEC